MNLSPVNGALLNGGRLIAVAASAAILASCAVNAVGTRIQDALAPSTSTGSFVAVPTHIHKADAQTFAGVGNLYPDAVQQKAATADFSTNAGIVAFVLRAASGSAFVSGTSNLLAIPASTLANSDVSASASVTADATKVQPGIAQIPGTAQITFDIEPVVTRVVEAQVLATSAKLYAEPGVNDVYGAYADVSGFGYATVEVAGLVTRPAQANLPNSATFAPNGTHVQNGRASPMAVSSLLVSSPNIVIDIGGLVLVGAQATISADALRVVTGAADSVGAATVTANTRVRHGSAASALTGVASLSGAGTATRPGVASAVGSATASATGLRVLVPQVDVATQGVLNANALRTLSPTSAIFGLAVSFVAQPNTTIREAGASMPGSALLDSVTQILREAESQIAGQAVATATALRTASGAATVSGSSYIFADTITNPASIDPLERTFFRLETANFVRPASTTDFRRAA